MKLLTATLCFCTHEVPEYYKSKLCAYWSWVTEKPGLEVASFSFAMVVVEAFLAERCARISRLLVVFFYVASSVYKTEKTEF